MDELQPVVSAAILAGGKGSRLGGRNKALVTLDGRPLGRMVIEALEDLFEEVFMVARSPRSVSDFGLRVVLDRYDHRCALTGIHAALDGADTPYVFVTACDTPFLQPGLVHALLEHIDGRADVIAPCRDGWYYYPLCAIYSKRCLPVVEERLERGDLQTVDFFEEVRVTQVPLERLLPFDPTLRSFLNVNTEEDLDTARHMLAI